MPGEVYQISAEPCDHKSNLLWPEKIPFKELNPVKAFQKNRKVSFDSETLSFLWQEKKKILTLQKRKS